jgi:hypothetical protein
MWIKSVHVFAQHFEIIKYNVYQDQHFFKEEKNIATKVNDFGEDKCKIVSLYFLKCTWLDEGELASCQFMKRIQDILISPISPLCKTVAEY